MTTLVIGGTGTTGSLVAGTLRAQGRPTRVASRRGAGDHVRFDWYDATTHAGAVTDVEVMYVIPPLGEPDPAPVMTPFLDLAARTGVRRAILLSSSAITAGTPGLGTVHFGLERTFPEWAVLRPSWFMENFTGNHPHARSAREQGEIVSATGDGRVAFVAARDIADVAVAALTDFTSHDTDHIITGPDPMSYDDVATMLTKVTGRPVRHRRVSAHELRSRLADAGLPEAFARLLADMDTAIAAGAEDRTTSVVADVTGHGPRSFGDVLSALC